MKYLHRAMRWMVRPPFREPAPYAAQMGFLRAARHELAGSYPFINPWVILRLLRKFRLKAFPESFFLEARPSVAFWLLLLASMSPSRVVDWHPLFSETFYRATNMDLRGLRAAPWMHYQVFGRAEGRVAHPLLDVERLAESMPGIRRADLIDVYLLDPDRWLIDTSRYIDLPGFVVNGTWDGITNPLKQVWAQGLLQPWVHTRLMIVDSASTAYDPSSLVAIGALALLRGPAGRLATFRKWASNRARSQASLGAATYTVIPGFFLGVEGVELVSDLSTSISPDSSMMRCTNGFVSIVSGSEIEVSSLLYFSKDVGREQLGQELAAGGGSVALAPSSANQESVLRTLYARNREVTVLDYGVQVRVRSSTQPRVIDDFGGGSYVEWNWTRADAKDVAIVLDYEHRRRAAADRNLRELIGRGAALCLVQDKDLSAWMQILEAREKVIADRVLLGLVGGLVDPGKLFALPVGELGNQS